MLDVRLHHDPQRRLLQVRELWHYEWVRVVRALAPSQGFVQFPDACSAALSGPRLAGLKAPRYINIENALVQCPDACSAALSGPRLHQYGNRVGVVSIFSF